MTSLPLKMILLFRQACARSRTWLMAGHRTFGNDRCGPCAAAAMCSCQNGEAWMKRH